MARVGVPAGGPLDSPAGVVVGASGGDGGLPQVSRDPWGFPRVCPASEGMPQAMMRDNIDLAIIGGMFIIAAVVILIFYY